MDKRELFDRISVDPLVAGGKPCVRDTRIYVATLLDGLAEGLTPEQLIDHYPQHYANALADIRYRLFLEKAQHRLTLLEYCPN